MGKTTIRQPQVELLLERINGNIGPGVVKKLLPELRVRESCGFKQRGTPSAPKDEQERPGRPVK
jgi:hypothetical protein